MSELKIYADENVNFAIVQGLQVRGVTAWASKEVGLQGKSDQQQLTYAAEKKVVFFTHDDDILTLANQWLQEGKEHWGIIYVHQKRLSIGECIRRLVDYTIILEAEDMKNCVEFL
jgi:hypothetical protein